MGGGGGEERRKEREGVFSLVKVCLLVNMLVSLV